jgi:membrane protein required for colicin V production
MSVLDIIVLLVLVLALIRGLMRGMVDTLFSLAGWILAFLAGDWGASALAPLLPFALESPSIRYFAAFALIFLAVLIAVLLLGHAVGSLVKAVGMGAADRVFGGVLGVVKGVVILVGLTIAAGLTSLPRTDFWKDASLATGLQAMALGILPLLPADLAKHVRFE